ncbi:MAG: dihydrodipicolinate reductase [Vicinamibacterales bacterium]
MAIRTLHIGLGPIGAGVARQCVMRRGFKLVGAVDIDPAKVGRDIGAVLGIGKRLRVAIDDDITHAIKTTRPDVALLCTSSALSRVMPQLEEVLQRKVPIVSTTEELAYPAGKNRRLAARVDAMARKGRVAVLGTGVNPGFTMDALPIMLTSVCEEVRSIRIDRVQNASSRRLPFQQKIGAGLTTDEFQARVRAGSVRHVGLTESITMIADAFGWKLDRVTDSIQPKIAEKPVASEYLTVERGRVAGLLQDGVGYVGGQPLITLHMEAYLGAPESFDAVTVDGNPPLTLKIHGGVHGDIATASIAVNAIAKVLTAPPGLRTMRDLAIPGWWSGRGTR